MRDLPTGIDQRSACRHPDWTGPDDLEIKIEELREITDWRIPIYVKVGATRTYYDVALAVKAGADAIVLDGMQGGTAATQEVFIEHVGIPILAAIPQAVESLIELGMHREVQLIVSGGIRTGADVAKALALGADAVSIGVAALIALGDNAPEHDDGLPRDRLGGRLLRRLPGGARSRRDLDPGRRARAPARPGRGRPAAGQLPAHARTRGADARACLRQVPPAQPRARGPRRADDRGGARWRGCRWRAPAGSPAGAHAAWPTLARAVPDGSRRTPRPASITTPYTPGTAPAARAECLRRQRRRDGEVAHRDRQRTRDRERALRRAQRRHSSASAHATRAGTRRSRAAPRRGGARRGCRSARRRRAAATVSRREALAVGIDGRQARAERPRLRSATPTSSGTSTTRAKRAEQVRRADVGGGARQGTDRDRPTTAASTSDPVTDAQRDRRVGPGQRHEPHRGDLRGGQARPRAARRGSRA